MKHFFFSRRSGVKEAVASSDDEEGECCEEELLSSRSVEVVESKEKLRRLPLKEEEEVGQAEEEEEEEEELGEAGATRALVDSGWSREGTNREAVTAMRWSADICRSTCSSSSDDESKWLNSVDAPCHAVDERATGKTAGTADEAADEDDNVNA